MVKIYKLVNTWELAPNRQKQAANKIMKGNSKEVKSYGELEKKYKGNIFITNQIFIYIKY